MELIVSRYNTTNYNLHLGAMAHLKHLSYHKSQLAPSIGEPNNQWIQDTKHVARNQTASTSRMLQVQRSDLYA